MFEITDPFNRVSGNLYQGRWPGDYLWALHTAKFNTIAFMAMERQPDPKWFAPIQVVLAPIDDDHNVLSQRDAGQIVKAARVVRESLDRGEKVLVTCAMGWNRSGVVSALALMLPHTPGTHGRATKACLTYKNAVAAVREARSENALRNPIFLVFLQNCEKICAGSQSASRNGRRRSCRL